MSCIAWLRHAIFSLPLLVNSYIQLVVQVFALIIVSQVIVNEYFVALISVLGGAILFDVAIRK